MSGFIFRRNDVIGLLDSGELEVAEMLGRFCVNFTDDYFVLMDSLGLYVFFDDRDLDAFMKYLTESFEDWLDGVGDILDEFDD